MKRNSTVALILAMLAGAGCGDRPVYRDEAFKEDSPFRRNLAVTAQRACEAAQLAMLSQAYRISMNEATEIRGQKDFQPGDDTNVTIDLDVICKDVTAGSIIFANAIQTKYELKKSSKTTSVGIPSVGSLSLPWGKTAENLVKVGGETISDEQYYARFFTLVKNILEPPPKKK
ncbi:MAG: DUF2242 domain-containing protein [Proteobacteria bacterium]|nr:DUF2242 domain-containing protein [Pseudomonadota bacterium]